MERTGPQSIRKTDLILCVFFIVFWIIPIFYTNLTKTKIPFFPKFISTIQTTSNLFTHANHIWPMPYIQVRLKGYPHWVDVPERALFQMETFGFRTRLYEALYLANREEEKVKGVQKELALWIAKQYEKLDPGSTVTEVRFIAGLQRARVGRTFEGHWRKLPLSAFKKEDIYEISRHKTRP